MEPSRVTLEEAQELFKSVCRESKKEGKTGSRLSGTDPGRAGICGSNPAAVSKVSDGWICTEKPGRLRGRS